jgi:Tfp pilus assembly protein PilF
MPRKKRPGASTKKRGLSPQSTTNTSQPNRERRTRIVMVTAVLLLSIGALLYALFGKSFLSRLLGSWQASSAPAYVGAQACMSCHAGEYEAWKSSDHALAMQHANAETVLGDFGNAKVTYNGIASTFFQRDGKFFVNTDGPDGKLYDYEIKYTFGIRPLQQYLIEMPDLRLQALSIAWDSRPKDQGGQRWFHLYPKEKITHEHELHWTRASQNWNFMCADCHSTELKKIYDPGTNSFKTQWAEINVGCEACHGPGSDHVSWAKSQDRQFKIRFAEGEHKAKGLTVSLDERRGVTWLPLAASGNAARSRARTSEREIEVCAQCHARRGQISEGYIPGKPWLDYYRPAFLTSPLYHFDGQQREEVYNWGSFLQSKMYANGVTCGDCHDPHSGKLSAQGNSVCATCHLESKYDATAHHHHEAGSSGLSCVNCHMPTTTYMIIDPRHDHSLRVPRPDLSLQLGTPNACNGCHKDRDARWATTQVSQWYGRPAQGYQRFADAFAAAGTGSLESQRQLRTIANDPTHPAIARATALVQVISAVDQSAFDTVAAGLRDRNPLLRLAALQSLGSAPLEARVRLAAPLLSDPLKTIRIEAASVLAAVPAAQMGEEQQRAFERASAEYVASQKYNADRADARVNLGTFYASRGDTTKAESEMKSAIVLDPSFVPAYVNLADLLRTQGRDIDAERVLRQGLKVAPKAAMLHHTLGLTLVRLKRTDEALHKLEQATQLEPVDARFAYVYAVALHSTGKAAAAIALLEKTLVAHPNDRSILEALASFHHARGDNVAAKRYAERLRMLTNGNQ